MKTENNYDVIRYILRNHASREKPIARKEIEDIATAMDCKVGRTAITGFMKKELVLTCHPKRNAMNFCEIGELMNGQLFFAKKAQIVTGQLDIGCWKQ